MDKQAEIARIKAEAEARNREIDRQNRNANLRIGGGAILQGVSALPIFNIPYVGTGLGGALFEAGNAIMEGKSGEDIKNDAGRGFLIGEAVGFLPPVVQKLSKTKAGQAVGNQASKLYNYLADTKVGQKVAEIAPKVEDALMTDIKAYNPFKKTQTVYHGSPYDFNKFSNEAIGTGEGAQAHGMGHYAALNKDVAEGYADRLGQYSLENPDKIIFDYQTNKDLIAAHQLGKEQFVKKLQNMIEIEDYDDEIVNLRNRIKNVEKNYDKVNLTRNKQLYKLSIPKDDVMLREDLLLSQQPKFVQQAFKDEIASFKKGLKEELQSNIDAKNILLESLQNAKAKGSDRLIYTIEKDIERNLPVYDTKIWQLQDQLNQNIPAAMNKTGRAIYDELGDNASNILSNKGIKGISYNGGIDGEARVIFNPDDIEIVRKYYNQPELWDKLKGLRPNEGAELAAIENALRNPQFPMNEQDFNAYEDLGLRYYQNIFQPNTIEIPGYGVASFSRKNRGKDDITNFRMYPDLFELLTGAKPVNRTNYKNELDRQYDYLENPNNKIYQFLMEDIKDKGKRYKMMRNKETGK